jgi:hypothetical protein
MDFKKTKFYKLLFKKTLQHKLRNKLIKISDIQ